MPVFALIEMLKVIFNPCEVSYFFIILCYTFNALQVIGLSRIYNIFEHFKFWKREQYECADGLGFLWRTILKIELYALKVDIVNWKCKLFFDLLIGLELLMKQSAKTAPFLCSRTSASTPRNASLRQRNILAVKIFQFYVLHLENRNIGQHQQHRNF